MLYTRLSVCTAVAELALQTANPNSNRVHERGSLFADRDPENRWVLLSVRRPDCAQNLLSVRAGLIQKSIFSPAGLIHNSIISPAQTVRKIYYQSGPD